MEWLRNYRADIARYKAYRKCSVITILLTEQGLWALLQYRVASGVFRSGLPDRLKRPLLVLLTGWQKLVEITTGISLPYGATIGPGLYIGHFGGIRVSPDATIGTMVNISQGVLIGETARGSVIVNDAAIIGETCSIANGVTIGVSGRGENRGVPAIGDRVYVGANAVLAGKIKVGSESVVAANALVTRDVPPQAVMLGNPAKVVSNTGSATYIDPEAEAKPATGAKDSGSTAS